MSPGVTLNWSTVGIEIACEPILAGISAASSGSAGFVKTGVGAALGVAVGVGIAVALASCEDEPELGVGLLGEHPVTPRTIAAATSSEARGRAVAGWGIGMGVAMIAPAPMPAVVRLRRALPAGHPAAEAAGRPWA